MKSLRNDSNDAVMIRLDHKWITLYPKQTVQSNHILNIDKLEKEYKLDIENGIIVIVSKAEFVQPTAIHTQPIVVSQEIAEIAFYGKSLSDNVAVQDNTMFSLENTTEDDSDVQQESKVSTSKSKKVRKSRKVKENKQGTRV
jgi:hypothetical protein